MQSSLQLWSLRSAIEADGWATTLRRAAEVGWSALEPFAVDATGEEILRAQRLDAALTTPSCHGFLERDRVAGTLAAAAAIGARTVFHPHFAPDFWADAAAVERTATTLIRAADLARAQGMVVGFHNHDFELTHTVDGMAAFDLLLEQLPAEIVVEYDVYWAELAGLDAATEVARLGGRVAALHIKDGRRVGGSLEQCALGEGDLDLDGVLAAAHNGASAVLSLDLMAGDAAALWRAVGTSRTWLDTRGIK